MPLTIAALLICAAVVFLAGVQIAKSGDIIAEKSGFGRTWVGVVLIASITSLPEAINGASSVLVFDVPEIAAGDLIGSCMFNLLIIALLDATSRSTPIFSRVSQGHVLAASFGIGLLTLVIVALLNHDSFIGLGWISPVSLMLIAVYLLATRTIFFYERRQRLTLTGGSASPVPNAYETVPLRHALVVFGFNATAIVIAASVLPGIGKRLAVQTGLEESVVGTLIIALTTSLPEVVVALTAIGIGATDLALGGLLGSNLFNLGILGFIDVLYVDAPIFTAISPSLATTAATAVIMTAITIIGLTLQPSRKPPYLAWDAILIVFAFLAGAVLIFTQG